MYVSTNVCILGAKQGRSFKARNANYGRIFWWGCKIMGFKMKRGAQRLEYVDCIVYIYMYICIHTHTHTHIYIYIYIYMYIYIYLYTYIFI